MAQWVRDSALSCCGEGSIPGPGISCHSGRRKKRLRFFSLVWKEIARLSFHSPSNHWIFAKRCWHCFLCGLFFLSIATVPLLISAVLPFVSCSPLSPLLLKSISDRVPFSSRIFHCWFSVPWRHFTFLRYSRPVTFHSPNFALLPLSARVLLSSPWSYFVVSWNAFQPSHSHAFTCAHPSAQNILPKNSSI